MAMPQVGLGYSLANGFGKPCSRAAVTKTLALAAEAALWPSFRLLLACRDGAGRPVRDSRNGHSRQRAADHAGALFGVCRDKVLTAGTGKPLARGLPLARQRKIAPVFAALPLLGKCGSGSLSAPPRPLS